MAVSSVRFVCDNVYKVFEINMIRVYREFGVTKT